MSPATTHSKPSEQLLAREKELEVELAQTRAYRLALQRHRPDPSISVPSRLRLFLTEYPLPFTVQQLAEAVAATDDTVRKALSHLTNCGFLIRTGHGMYALDPFKGPLDWESAKALRGWEDP